MGRAKLGKGKYPKHLSWICGLNETLQGHGDTLRHPMMVTDPPVLQQTAVLVPHVDVPLPLALLWNTRGAVVCSSITTKSVFFFSSSMSSAVFIVTKTTMQGLSFWNLTKCQSQFFLFEQHLIWWWFVWYLSIKVRLQVQKTKQKQESLLLLLLNVLGCNPTLDTGVHPERCGQHRNSPPTPPPKPPAFPSPELSWAVSAAALDCDTQNPAQTRTYPLPPPYRLTSKKETVTNEKKPKSNR